MNYEFHPIADIFPLMVGPDFDELVEDIKRNGQITPIVIYENMILDGRNRYLACEELDIEPWTMEFERMNSTGDPLGYVLSLNLYRRHLELGQRAMVAAKAMNLKRGGDRKSEDFKEPIGSSISQSLASDMFDVGEGSIGRARAVIASEDKELIEAVERGTTTLNAAYEKVRTQKTVPQSVLTMVRKEEVYEPDDLGKLADAADDAYWEWRNAGSDKEAAEKFPLVQEAVRKLHELSWTIG